MISPSLEMKKLRYKEAKILSTFSQAAKKEESGFEPRKS